MACPALSSSYLQSDKACRLMPSLIFRLSCSLFSACLTISRLVSSFSRRPLLFPTSELGTRHLCCDTSPQHASVIAPTVTTNGNTVLVQVALTYCHRLRGLNHKCIRCLTVLEAGSLRSGCQHAWVLDDVPLLVCRGLSSCCVLVTAGSKGSACLRTPTPKENTSSKESFS